MLRKAHVSYVLIGASPGFSRLDATKVSTRGLAEMEVTASQLDDFAVGRVITGRFHAPCANTVLPSGASVAGSSRFPAHDQDRFTVLQSLIDPRKEGRIVVGFAGADGVGLVMHISAYRSAWTVRSSASSNPR